ncbi:MAG: hypothetical protein GEV10_20255 [Streptosporangiales bacterium]|nr:hypothetical protein [Streptosporangiales bacterium]
MIDVTEAARQVDEAMRALTASLVDGRPEDEVARRNLEVLRALAEYRDAANRPEYPSVLSWVPPIVEVEDLDDEHEGRDKILHSATWVFTVDDHDKVVADGRRRLAPTERGNANLDTSADVVSALFDEEMTWPDFQAYEEMGLSLAVVDFSSQTLVALDGDVSMAEINR